MTDEMAVDLGSQHLRAAVVGGVLRVTIDRPERRNALTIEMYHGLKKAAVLAERTAAVTALLITGTGDFFCVGGEMAGQHEGSQQIDRETERFDLLPFAEFERCPKVVVTAVNGLCHGGGLNLVLFSDLSIASDRARFRAPELLRGVADCFLAARLATRVGVARAKDLLFTAREISAAEAGAIGLVGRVVPSSQLPVAVEQLLAEIRQTAPRARTLVKRDMNRHLPPIDYAMFAESLASDEVKEGFAAFREKRMPSWAHGS
ncbi:MAG: enoyl-CoA hydratase/isomerase family protein [Candidatus Binatia bacterium]|nr:enoyl-CoA hydratase/isomerase family protein [Candidatus Binatia bacterium]